ncbi:uncharacterized protein LOC112452703 [Temnothorax curvispinosus]|uniref:Uncharacterized protein LOC112452703 n=1 Tax=Temnothorax curvispinosus TaxID=300111 RepID=A0A6J1PGZ7_9HYME|nr:uncharacterized protein LOC112452703 [Temnothorax curvispinosus]
MYLINEAVAQKSLIEIKLLGAALRELPLMESNVTLQHNTKTDVRIFLDGAKNGAIVISLGTNMKWKHLNLNTVKTVILALSKLKQRVLWKLDIKVAFEIPENVMVIKWMLQSEVLSQLYFVQREIESGCGLRIGGQSGG